MATTTTVLNITERKGPHVLGGKLHCLEVAVKVTGTYAAAGRPSFDLLAALQTARRQGISAVSVKKVVAFQDGDDGTNVYTAANANIVLSGTGSKVTTFQIQSGATNGDTGSEIADSTAVNHVFSFIVITSITGYGV